MNAYHREQRSHLEFPSTSTSRLRQTAAAALMVLAAVVTGGIPVAQAQDREVKPMTFTETRDTRYCEFIVVRPDGVEIYNTIGLNDCPPELWDALDVEQLAKELGALKVQLNGPHYWMTDSNGFLVGEIVSFGGIEARWGATLDPAVLGKSQKGTKPYTVFSPKKKHKQVFKAGKPVFELVDPDGHVYVLQAHEEEFPIESLPKLGERMKKLPAGWQYHTRMLTEDLVLDLGPDRTIYVVSDEFHQYYTRPPR